MFEIEYKDIKNIDVSDWLNKDKSLNIGKMQEYVKKKVIESHIERQKWQEWALKNKIIGHILTD